MFQVPINLFIKYIVSKAGMGARAWTFAYTVIQELYMHIIYYGQPDNESVTTDFC